MTCIAGLVHKGQVWLASDKQVTWGWSKMPCVRKIVEIDDLAIATCGQMSVIGAYETRLQLPDIPEEESKYEQWLRVQVADAMRIAVSKAGVLETSDGVMDSGSESIIGWRGKLVAVCQNFGVMDVAGDYLARGSGGEVALGSLYSTEGKGPEARLTTAINAANMWSVGCGCDVHVVKVG